MNALLHPPRDAAPLVLAAGRPSRTLVVLALLIGICGTFALGLAISDQVERGSSGHAIAFAFLGVLVAGVVSRKTGTASASGHLQIDADGASSWRPAHPSPGRGGRGGPPGPPEHRCDPSAFQPLAWFCFLGIVWITGQCDGASVRLILARDSLPDDDWIRLRRWLRWLDRGGHAPGLSSSEAPASPLLLSDVRRLKGRP